MFYEAAPSRRNEPLLSLLLVLSVLLSPGVSGAEEATLNIPFALPMSNHGKVAGAVHLSVNDEADPPYALVLFETESGLKLARLTRDGPAEVKPLDLSTLEPPYKGTRHVDDIGLSSDGVVAVHPRSGTVYRRGIDGDAPAPVKLGVRKLDRVILHSGRVYGVRGDKVVRLTLYDGSIVQRKEPAFKDAESVCIESAGLAIYRPGPNQFLDEDTLEPVEVSARDLAWTSGCDVASSGWEIALTSFTVSGGLVSVAIDEGTLHIKQVLNNEEKPLWTIPDARGVRRIGTDLLLWGGGEAGIGWWKDFSRSAAVRARPEGSYTTGDCQNGIGFLVRTDKRYLLGAFKDGLFHGRAIIFNDEFKKEEVGEWEHGLLVSDYFWKGRVPVQIPAKDGALARGDFDQEGQRVARWLTLRDGVVEKIEIFVDGILFGTCISADGCAGSRGRVQRDELGHC